MNKAYFLFQMPALISGKRQIVLVKKNAEIHVRKWNNFVRS